MIYVPRAFQESDPAALHALIDSASFATLISPDADDPIVTHLPLLLDPTRGAHGTLLGHVARGNPHWRRLQERPQALAIFHGPHAYVSPSWYATHPSVPTWNYAVVHAHGSARLIEDAAKLEQLMRRLVETFENPRPAPWRMELPDDYRQKMMGGIVGFEIEIERLVGKFKLSQNRDAVDQGRVIDALEQSSAHDQDTAALMRTRAAHKS